MESPLLSMRGVNKSFGKTTILRDLDFDVRAGEILGFWGKNASGKTTLANMLCGETRPDSGEILLQGRALGIHSVEQAKQAGVGVIFGDVQLIESLSIAENLLLGNMRGISLGPGKIFIRHTHIRRVAAELCAKHEIDLDVDEPVRSLSLPERQKVNLLRVAFQAPRLLVIDDAFSSLSGNELAKAYAIVNRLSRSGSGILFLSHNHRQLCGLCSVVAKLEDCRLSGRLAPDAFNASLPKTEKSGQIIPKLRVSGGDILFSCQNLCYKNIVRNVSLELRGGEVLGILGAGNSGRTTMARVLYGDLPSSLGKIFLRGKPMDMRNPGVALNHRVALMLDDSNRFSLIAGADLTRNITLSKYSNRIFRKNFIVSGQRERLEAEVIAERLGVKRSGMGQKAGELSASAQKLVILGRWLSARCEIFLLDEPTQRLDAPGKIQIYNVINELSRQGKGVIVFTSDIHESLGICNRILTLHNGEINGEFAAESTDFDTLHEKIFR